MMMVLLSAVLITRSYYSSEQAIAAESQVPRTTLGIPSVSALMGQDPVIQFDAKQFFKTAYYSPVTTELEENFRRIAKEQANEDREGFYARFLGVGLAAHHYELTWTTIFGSQLAAMEELNARGVIPLSDVEKHYNQAVENFPDAYRTYTFAQWFAYMQGKMLVATYPSKMVELSWLGKDFLKYLSHTARDPKKEVN